MYTKTLSAGLLAILASSVSAQTFTDCNPLKKDCPDDPALGRTVVIDYTKGEDKSGFFKALSGTTITYGDKGAVFTIAKEGQAPTLVSNSYIFFGKVEIELQVAPGVGVVTSVVLQSDDLDEIDWEWLGGDSAQVQTNYFSKGDTSTYDRGKYHPIANPQSQFYKYTIEWTPDSVKWEVNGAVIRELKYADAKGGSYYPQTPAQLRIGTWVGGSKEAAKGTVEWAGGLTNFADAPFIAYYKSITITDYMGGKTGAKAYKYGDRSGTYQSIIVKTDGASSGNDTSSSSSSSSSTTKPTSTSSRSSSTIIPSASTTASPSATGGSSSNSTGTGSGSGSQTSGSGSGSSGTAGAATTSSTRAPGSAGVANLPNVILMGAAMVLGYLVL